MNPYEKLAKLKELYPEDVARIEADEQRLSDLLKQQEYAALPVSQEVLALCRKDILTARKMLATNRTLTEQERAECWHIIEAREWFVKLVAKDYASELVQIDQELDRELAQ